MKKFSILALSATIITAPVFAETTTYPTPSVELSTQFNEATDLSFAFDDTQNLQATVMTDSEMQETEGAVAPWVAGVGLGAAAGGIGYTYGWARGNYKWSNAKFAGNVTTGAVIGGTFGAAGAAAGGGLTVGANAWRFNSFALNSGVNKAWRR